MTKATAATAMMMVIWNQRRGWSWAVLVPVLLKTLRKREGQEQILKKGKL
jgi:hypothetical protein